MSPMFTPAAGPQSAVADLSAQVASLLRQVKELREDVDDLMSALEAATHLPTPMYPSSGNESGEIDIAIPDK